MEYPAHPISEIFPMMTEQEYKALKDDIEKNGLQYPIMLYQDMILDGRNRFNACLDTGTEPVYVYYKGKNPEAYVLSVNLHRRQLSKAQASLVAARIADAPQGRPGKDANLRSLDDAASLLSVSPKNVEKAKSFLANAEPALVKLVEEPGSKLSLDAACKVAELPKEEQQDVASQGVKAVKVKAAALRNPMPAPAEQKIDEKDSKPSVKRFRKAIIDNLMEMRQSAFNDPTSLEALDAVIAECENLKREIQERGIKQ